MGSPDADLKLWREAMHHAQFRAWAEETLGERRQVYARHAHRAVGAGLVFMPDGEALAFRAAAQAGELLCPVPGCPSPRLTTYASNERRDHFRHLQAPADPQHNAAYQRIAARRLLADWIADMPIDYAVTEDTTIENVPVSLLVQSPTGRRLAICIIYERLGRDAWAERFRTLKSAGVPSAWVFGLRPMYFRPPQVTELQDGGSVQTDRARGDVILEAPLFAEMRAARCWPLLLSLESRQLANVLSRYSEPARALTPPACQDRVALIVAGRLKDARLDRHGIATPTVGPDLLADAYAPATPAPRPAPPVPRSLAPAASASGPSDDARWEILQAAKAQAHQPLRPPVDEAEVLPADGETISFGELLDRFRERGWSPDRLDEHVKELLYERRIARRVDFQGPITTESPIKGPTPRA